jgi:hypothetical protein
MLSIGLETRTSVEPVWTSAARTSGASMARDADAAKLFRRPATGPAGRFTGLSSPVFGTGHWQVACTGRTIQPQITRIPRIKCRRFVASTLQRFNALGCRLPAS